MNICVLLIECYLCLTLTATSVYLSYKAEIYTKLVGDASLLLTTSFTVAFANCEKTFPE